MELKSEESRHEILSTGMVVPETTRCVQCGICSYNCPSGIDVRLRAWQGQPIEDSRCLTCGQCIARCPRGVLRFERLAFFEKQTTKEPKDRHAT